jgi:hypothetical protein
MFREKWSQVPPVPQNYNVTPPPPRTAAPPPFLPLDIKDLLKEDTSLFDEGRLFGWGF